MSSPSKYKYVSQKTALHTPPLQDIRDLLQNGLPSYFEQCQVEVVSCPDLKQAPFNLAQSGLCGNERIADVGGVSNLVPTPKLETKYSLREISSVIGLTSKSFMIGAGAGPYHRVGTNCELMPNIYFENGTTSNNCTYVAKVDSKGGCDLSKIASDEGALMVNLFACEGRGGNVLKVTTKKRIGKENFTNSIRKLIGEKYGQNPVSLGGVFIIKRGKANMHVMPNFSPKPLNSDAEVDKWLKFYDMSAPMVCLSVFHSHDPGLGLRMEHTHCFSDHGEGGHYHDDTTPDDVEYEGYFNVAKELYKVELLGKN